MPRKRRTAIDFMLVLGCRRPWKWRAIHHVTTTTYQVLRCKYQLPGPVHWPRINCLGGLVLQPRQSCPRHSMCKHNSVSIQFILWKSYQQTLILLNIYVCHFFAIWFCIFCHFCSGLSFFCHCCLHLFGIAFCICLRFLHLGLHFLRLCLAFLLHCFFAFPRLGVIFWHVVCMV